MTIKLETNKCTATASQYIRSARTTTPSAQRMPQHACVEMRGDNEGHAMRKAGHKLETDAHHHDTDDINDENGGPAHQHAHAQACKHK